MRNVKARRASGKNGFRKKVNGVMLGSIVSAGLFVPTLPAFAQSDVQGQSVADRNAPEFSSKPINLGPFEAFPSIELTTQYNDNIFALNNTQIDDVIFSLRPKLLLRDRRPDRIVRINLAAGVRKFAETDTENSEQFTAAANGRWGLGTETEYRVGAIVNRNIEQRREIDSFITVAEPIAFTNLEANAGISREFGPLRASLDGRVRGVEYDGITRVNGQEFDLAFRDFQVYSAQARLSYARSRDQEVYVQLTADQRNYEVGPVLLDGRPLQPFDRSSQGGRLEVGYRQQITELLYLDVRGGYLFQDFDDPSLSTVNGVAFQTDVLWNATPLTSVRVSGIRRVDETVNPLISGLVRTEVAAQVEHELLRNFVITARASYADLNQLDSLNDGDQWTARITGDYRLNRNWAVTFEAEHYERSGLFDFTQNEVGIGLRYSF